MRLPIYLDYAATTPVDPQVAQKMCACLTLDGNFANPASRSHLYGWQAEEAVELAEKLARYGASYVMLLHPNEVDHKYRFLEQILPRLKPFAWFGTMSQYGSWWAARDKVEVDVLAQRGQIVLNVQAQEPIKDLVFELPTGLRPVSGSAMQKLSDGRWLFRDIPAGTIMIDLHH